MLLAATLPGAATAQDEPRDTGSARLEARFEMSLHSTPDGPGFRSPGAISADLFGNVFVADTGNHRVVHFDADGRFVFEFGGYGWNDGELSSPTDVSAREGFRLFVVDAGNERIQQFDISDSSPEGEVFPFREGEGLFGVAESESTSIARSFSCSVNRSTSCSSNGSSNSIGCRIAAGGLSLTLSNASSYETLSPGWSSA